MSRPGFGTRVKHSRFPDVVRAMKEEDDESVDSTSSQTGVGSDDD